MLIKNMIRMNSNPYNLIILEKKYSVALLFCPSQSLLLLFQFWMNNSENKIFLSTCSWMFVLTTHLHTTTFHQNLNYHFKWFKHQFPLKNLVRFFCTLWYSLTLPRCVPNIHEVSCITNYNYYPNYTYNVLLDKSACLKLLVFDSLCRTQ